jgi:hypothetical protein
MIRRSGCDYRSSRDGESVEPVALGLVISGIAIERLAEIAKR